MKTIILTSLSVFLVSFVFANLSLSNERFPWKNSRQNIELWHQSEKESLSIPLKLPGLFNSQLLTWKWDTIITYDTTGLHQRWSQILDLNGHTVIQKIDGWKNGNWTNSGEDSCAFNAKGDILFDISEFWTGDRWDSSRSWRYTYNMMGHRTAAVLYMWVYGTWTAVSILTYSTDSNGNIRTVETKGWNSIEYVNTSRSTYTYDPNGNKLTETQEHWESNNWANNSRYTYTYNEYGDRMTLLHELWQSNAWVSDYRVTNSFNNLGFWLSSLTEAFQSGLWVQKGRTLYTNDAVGNILTELEQQFNNSTWINLNRTSYSYDSHGNSLTAMYERWKNGDWHADVGALGMSHQQFLDYFINDNRYEAKYINFINVVPHYTDNNILHVYPNPAAKMFTVEFHKNINVSSIEVFDLTGKVQYNKILQPFMNRIDIDVSGWRKGVYMVRVQLGTSIVPTVNVVVE